MYVNETIACCGIREFDDIENILDLETEFIEILDNELVDSGEGEYDGPAFLFFSTTQDSPRGDELKTFIEKNKLGEVLKSRARKNPSSGNMLTMYTWGINKKNLMLYWAKHRVNDED